MPKNPKRRPECHWSPHSPFFFQGQKHFPYKKAREVLIWYHSSTEKKKLKKNMGSFGDKKPHAVCVPFPAQGHVNPMMQLAKLLHSRGFHITFVNTEFNHNRLIRSAGLDSVKGMLDFRFETIPDGMSPPSTYDATQDVPSLCDATRKHCLAPFKELVTKLNSSSSAGVPPVSCIISDGVMSFGIKAAKELSIPQVQFWTASACSFMAYLHYNELERRGIMPYKGISLFIYFDKQNN